MAGQSFITIGWRWTEEGVLGSQVFGHALVESIGDMLKKKGIINKWILLPNRVNFILYFKIVTFAMGTISGRSQCHLLQESMSILCI